MNSAALNPKDIYLAQNMRFHHFVFTGKERNEKTDCGYFYQNKPHAPRRVFRQDDGALYDLYWDTVGNLVQCSRFHPGSQLPEESRFLFWSADSRLHSVVDGQHYSYYAYDDAGTRRLKLSGGSSLQDVNAVVLTASAVLNTPTLYPSPYLVVDNHGYTKHYYAGSERVCARVGKGGLGSVLVPQGAQQATDLFDSCNLAVGLRIDNAPNQCLSGSGPLATALPHRPAGIVATACFDYAQLHDVVASLQAGNASAENEVYFSHSYGLTETPTYLSVFPPSVAPRCGVYARVRNTMHTIIRSSVR